MNSEELRQNFLDFFKAKDHKIISSASLIPKETDPSALFTTAGMHPLVPYLLGEVHPKGKRLVSVQKCIRTGDIEAVGDDVHLTFFEMLGNWSLGDPASADGIGQDGYFKSDAIAWSLEFLNSIGINKEDLAVSVFAGDDDSPRDNESAKIWQDLGITQDRIAYLQKKDNFWGPVGGVGPCGPDTEMFVWQGEGEIPKIFNPKDSDWVEVWNDVFMQYNKIGDNKFEPLSQKNVDTGMGMERMTAYLEGKKDLYQTELFWPIIEKIEELSHKKYDQNQKEMRIIADHLKAATFIIADGVEPSNKDQGYVVRRLIRRAIVKAKQIGIEENLTNLLSEIVIEIYKDIYPDLGDKKENVKQTLQAEEEKFRRTLTQGMKEFEKMITDKEGLTGEEAFNLYQTYGFPLELTEELIKDKGLNLDKEGFETEFAKHKELSRTASAGMFKGGLADSGEETKKLHTAAHLLLAALRQVLGSDVFQKGSNITSERLRFDFSYSEKLTPEQLKQVEDLVNEQIKKAIPVEMQEMSLSEAKKAGAMGVFESKYGDQVKVYTIGDFSKEICGGPHAENTSELGHFKIVKEESSSAGVRRIKAVLE